jgi:hypothetical protein
MRFGGDTMDETRKILESILHQLELLNAKYDSLDKRMGNVEDQLENLSASMTLFSKIPTDNNHRIADIE